MRAELKRKRIRSGSRKTRCLNIGERSPETFSRDRLEEVGFGEHRSNILHLRLIEPRQRETSSRFSVGVERLFYSVPRRSISPVVTWVCKRYLPGPCSWKAE